MRLLERSWGMLETLLLGVLPRGLAPWAARRMGRREPTVTGNVLDEDLHGFGEFWGLGSRAGDG